MNDNNVKALVLTGFGINCDYETQYACRQVGAEADIIHINELIDLSRTRQGLSQYHIFVVDGGFAWADDHGAGVLLGLKIKSHLGAQIDEFIADGKLIIGICNGFQALVNMGLLPGFDNDYHTRAVALAANERNYRDQWVNLVANQESPCIFTKGIEQIDLPIRHGEGKFFAPQNVIDRLEANGQIVLRYAKPLPEPRRGQPHVYPKPTYAPARGEYPFNPNGSLDDIAGICDETGRVFGLMPHPEGYHHLTSHPDWTRLVDHRKRWDKPLPDSRGDGLKVFTNAVDYVIQHLL